MIRRIALLAIAATMGALLTPGSAHAYLDPGTGSIVLQALIGGIVAAAAFARIYWRRIKNFIFRRSSRARSDGTNVDE